MKKYLMTGMAAIAFCAAFTSCSKDENLYDPKAIEEMETAQVYEAYNRAFIATFGQVHPNQTWGFGDGSMTRANSGDTYPATHKYTDASGNVVAGANMNHNEWADPDKEFGGYTVPDPLTDEQKAVVAAYFQSVTPLGYEDPGLRHFFVQQVYKGGNAAVRQTTEGIAAAAENVYYTSDNMNLLTVGQANSHINDFNAGTCSESAVLDNGQHVGGTSHTDQITLMVNVDDTSCFGYHETGSSTHHNDKAALVSWQTIRDWANSNGLNGNCLDDKWNRSFLGFDLAIKEGSQAYATDEAGNVQYADYSQAPTSPAYAWDGNNIIEIKAKVANQWGGFDFTDFLPAYQNIMKGTEAIGWLTTNENFYVAADKVILTDEANASERPISEVYSDNVLVFKDVKVEGASNNKAHVLNLKRIQELVGQGYLPVNNKSLTEWVKVGKSDGYFSDWIVTLTEAKRQTPSEYEVRIMAEDLNAEAVESENDIENSDWDFNDVVFDVKFNEDGSQATVQLVAAGGVLPLRIYDGNGTYYEVHERFGQSRNSSTGWYPMINTGGIAQISGATAQPFTVYNPGVNGYNIKIEVNKFSKNADGTPGEDHWYELTARKGQPAAKFAVKPSVQPLTERTHVDYSTNGAFSRAVQDGTWLIWWE